MINYLQALKSSEESLREQVQDLVFHFPASKQFNIRWSYFVDPILLSIGYQLEKAKKKEAAFIVTFAKREQEIAELKVGNNILKLRFLFFIAVVRVILIILCYNTRLYSLFPLEIIYFSWDLQCFFSWSCCKAL